MLLLRSRPSDVPQQPKQKEAEKSTPTTTSLRTKFCAWEREKSERGGGNQRRKQIWLGAQNASNHCFPSIEGQTSISYPLPFTEPPKHSPSLSPTLTLTPPAQSSVTATSPPSLYLFLPSRLCNLTSPTTSTSSPCPTIIIRYYSIKDDSLYYYYSCNFFFP